MKKPEILFLKQEDVVAAGLLDMKMVLDVVEETCLGLSGGCVINPPKIKLGLPDNENWTSFFMSMPAYVKGNTPVAGFKWAAESKRNATVPGMPYGVDVVTLSDPDTVYPKAIMDGTLITAMRTSAMAGVMAKRMARKNSSTVCLVGAGVIGRTMIMAMNEVLPELKEILLRDLNEAKAEDLASEFRGKIGKVNVVPSRDLEESVRKSDVVVTETTSRTPFLKRAWLKDNATVIQMSSYEIEDDVLLGADRVAVDNWEQLSRGAGTLVKKLADEGKLKREDVAEIHELVSGEKPGRRGDDELTVSCLHGVGAIDVAVANRIYEMATEKGIGQRLVLWDNPLWV
ncbi:MAG: ornithine cyclodeaminase family protein [Synergistaceae bacterium]|nr:ornithine cyclodeaminase family protein [Synergistaceae bacterium]